MKRGAPTLTVVENTATRGSGTTTRQMMEAPEGAIFVWCNDFLLYPRELARYLGREDLIIATPNDLSSHRFTGYPVKGFVLDHACELTERQAAEAQYLRLRASHG